MEHKTRSGSGRRRVTRRRPWPIRLIQLVLTVTIAVSSVALVGVVFGQVTHRFRLAPVLSGSMSPSIDTGALVLAEPVRPSTLEPGDILLFNAPIDGDPLVMHRIYDEQLEHGTSVFTTKGDANDAPDAWAIRVRGPVAWRVRHALPYVGTVIGWLGQVGARMIVLIGGVSLLLLWGLRAVWGRAPISWHARDPHGVRQARTRRRTNRRSATLIGVGTFGVLALATAGLAGAQFTATPTPPLPAVGSGSLDAPSPASCKWTSGTQITFDWTDGTPTFTTGYNVLRSNTSGSGYASVGTASPQSTTTFVNAPPTPVTTQRYYVVDATRGTWSSPHSSEMQSGQCTWAIETTAGSASQGYAGDGGPATAAKLNNPQALAIASNGDIYISDTGNNVIRKVTASTGIITTVIGGGGSTACTYSGSPTGVKLAAPDGVTIDDATGDIYLADTNNGCIRKLSGGTLTTVVDGSSGSTACSYSGVASGVKLNKPQGVNFDSADVLYIADTGANCIRKLSGGNVSPVAGGGGTTACTYSGVSTGVSMSAPDSVKSDGNGNVYVADSGRNCIRKVSGGNVSQVAGGGGTTACTYSGAASGVSLSAPKGLGIDPQGRIIITDSSRRCLRIISGSNISQYAGTGTNSSTGDGGPAVAATTGNPTGIGIAPDGSVYFAGEQNDTIRHIIGVV